MEEKNNKFPLNEELLKEVSGGNGASLAAWKCSSCGNKRIRIITPQSDWGQKVEVECLSCGTRDFLNIILAVALAGDSGTYNEHFKDKCF